MTTAVDTTVPIRTPTPMDMPVPSLEPYEKRCPRREPELTENEACENFHAHTERALVEIECGLMDIELFTFAGPHTQPGHSARDSLEVPRKVFSTTGLWCVCQGILPNAGDGVLEHTRRDLVIDDRRDTAAVVQLVADTCRCEQSVHDLLHKRFEQFPCFVIARSDRARHHAGLRDRVRCLTGATAPHTMTVPVRGSIRRLSIPGKPVTTVPSA